MDMQSFQSEILTPFVDHLPLPPVIHPSHDAARECSHLQIHMQKAKIRLHLDLPMTDMWAYEGVFPGPTIEVNRNQKVVVEWVDNLHGRCRSTK